MVESVTDRRTDAWLVLALMAACLLPRLVVFPIAENWFGDSIIRSELGERWANRPHWIGSFDDGVYQFGPLHIYLLGALTWLWRSREHAGRVVSLICGVLTVWPLFALTRQLFGRAAAVVACLGLSLWGMHVQFSTTAASESLGVLTVVATMACFASALQSERVAPLVGTAACLALACATRYDAWLLIPLMCLLLVWQSPNRRRGLERAVLLGVLCVPFPLFWLLGHYASRGDALYAIKFIDDFHRQWFPDGEATWGRVEYRLQNLFFWPGVALATLTPLLAALSMVGMVRAWRRGDARWLVVVVLVPTLYFTVRSTLLGTFAPLARFAAIQVALLLPFAWAGAAGRWQRPLTGAALALALLMNTALGLFTFHRAGKYEDMWRPISPVSTQPVEIMQVARFLQADGGAFILDSDEKEYRDLTIAYFSGRDESQIARYRWWEVFDSRLSMAQPKLLVRIEGGAMDREPKLHVDGRVATFRGVRFDELDGFAPPFHVYRQAQLGD